MSTPSQPYLSSEPDQIRRAVSSDLKETAGCSTPLALRAVEIKPSGKLLVVLDLSIAPKNNTATRRTQFSGRDVRELGAMAESDPRAEVRQAAAAILHYALGGTLEASAAGTTFGIGWVRGLLAAIHVGGIEALTTRSYRQRRRNAE